MLDLDTVDFQHGNVATVQKLDPASPYVLLDGTSMALARWGTDRESHLLCIPFLWLFLCFSGLFHRYNLPNRDITIVCKDARDVWDSWKASILPFKLKRFEFKQTQALSQGHSPQQMWVLKASTKNLKLSISQVECNDERQSNNAHVWGQPCYIAEVFVIQTNKAMLYQSTTRLGCSMAKFHFFPPTYSRLQCK